MGDVAMTVPVLLNLTEQYPQLKITVLTKAFFAPIFSDIPNVSVYKSEVKDKHKGIWGLFKLYRELIQLDVDMVADLHHVLRSTILKQFFRFSAIPYIQVDKGRAEKKALIHPDRKVFQPLKTTFQRYADVFEKLGYPLELKKEAVLIKRETPSSLKTVLSKDGKSLIGIAPFAAFEGKRYPLNLMESVIKELNDTNVFKIVLFGGGKQEIEVLTTWENRYENTFSSAGKFSFSDELSLISNLDLMLAMDSGNAHLAAMFGVPTITLWGVTHPFAGFYPYGQPESNSLLADRTRFPLIPTSIYGNKYPLGYGNAMETILPDTVVQKIKEILKEAV